MKVAFNGYKAMIRFMLLGGFVSMVVVSCKNDIETINAMTSDLRLPDITAYDFESVFNDSGLMKGRIVAPEANQYDKPEDPYIEFPQGLKVYLYDTAENLESYIEANYAIFYSEEEIWEIRNKVIGERLVTGEKLETDLLFWNQKEKRVYSDQFTKITNPDGVYYGENGFEADEDLSQYELFGARGVINVEEDQQPEGQHQENEMPETQRPQDPDNRLLEP